MQLGTGWTRGNLPKADFVQQSCSERFLGSPLTRVGLLSFKNSLRIVPPGACLQSSDSRAARFYDLQVDHADCCRRGQGKIKRYDKQTILDTEHL